MTDRTVEVRLADNVLGDSDWPRRALTFDRYLNVVAHKDRYRGVYSMDAMPTTGWSFEQVAEWLSYDSTGRHPEEYHEVMLAGSWSSDPQKLATYIKDASSAPAYPEHERMRQLKMELGIDRIATSLEELVECRIPYALLADNEPLWEKFVLEDDFDRWRRFLAWVEEHTELPLDREGCLHPSAPLFAAYADIDLDKIDDEKREMIEHLRELNGRAS